MHILILLNLNLFNLNFVLGELKSFSTFTQHYYPLKIKTLVIFDSSGFTNSIEELPIQLLIQKIGPYIENLSLSIYINELRKKIFDMVIDFCEKIKFLHLNYIDDFVNISQLSKMIFNF